MSQLGVRRIIAAMAGMVSTGFAAHAADLQGERYALADPVAYRQATPQDVAAPAKTTVVRAARKKAKPDKTIILTGLQNYRMPAQRALDRIGRPTNTCPPASFSCPNAYPEAAEKSQSWQHATLPQASESEADPAAQDMPANGQPSLVRPFTDVPGFVPGRESSYRFTFHVPMGRYENIQLQANIRRNAYNTIDSSDSTLRADWSLRF